MLLRRAKTLIVATVLLAVCSAIAAANALAGSDPHAGHWATLPAIPGLGPLGTCPDQGSNLVPGSDLTLIYRVQRPFDAELLGEMKAEAPAKLPFRSQDIFMVQSRGTAGAYASEMVSRLTNPDILSGELFRCNRVFALTGVGAAATAAARESAFKLMDDSRVQATTIDWEKPLWRYAYGNSPVWSRLMGTNITRLQSRVKTIHASGKEAGTVITSWRNRGPRAWKYGALARRSGLDFSILQTQEDCKLGTARFATRAHRLIHQYRDAGVPLSALGMEIAFSQNPGSTPPKNDVTPAQAANCTRVAYAAGVKGFFLWAHPRGMKDYFAALPSSLRS